MRELQLQLSYEESLLQLYAYRHTIEPARSITATSAAASGPASALA